MKLKTIGVAIGGALAAGAAGVTILLGLRDLNNPAESAEKESAPQGISAVPGPAAGGTCVPLTTDQADALIDLIRTGRATADQAAQFARSIACQYERTAANNQSISEADRKATAGKVFEKAKGLATSDDPIARRALVLAALKGFPLTEPQLSLSTEDTAAASGHAAASDEDTLSSRALATAMLADRTAQFGVVGNDSLQRWSGKAGGSRTTPQRVEDLAAINLAFAEARGTPRSEPGLQ